MLIRKATDADKPAIVELLRQSLGDQSSPKSIAYWSWKHEQNPFGESAILLSEDAGQITGVRAMMPWAWQQGNHQFKTFRAVDTATHPDFQGKGIFRKLTMRMIEELAAQDGEFIFNTPNKNSLPGYLKMGWREWGRVKVFVLPAAMLRFKRLSIQVLSNDIGHTHDLCLQWNDRKMTERELYTPKTPDYLAWRYLNNPVINYQITADKDLFVAAYIKQHRRFNELRISEVIASCYSPLQRNRFLEFIYKLAEDNKVQLITLSHTDRRWLSSFGISLAVGPKLTIRQLNQEIKIPDIKKWSPALGDLELF